MHAVPRNDYWTFRYREWVETTEAEYEKKFKGKKKKPKTRKDNGKFYYEFYKTIPLKDLKKIYKTKPEAEADISIYEAKYDSRLAQRQQREAWHDEYYNFKDLIEIYTKNRVKSAPNSWESKINWFKNYVMYFFYSEKHATNLEEWKFHFKAFKDYLSETKGSRNGKTLTVASRNHCINELNYFLNLMFEEGKCDAQPKLRLFSGVDNHKTAKDLVSEKEFQAVLHQLQLQELAEGNSTYYSDCYQLLRVGGFRINELLGIGLNNVRQGKPPREELNQLLKKHNIGEIYSYMFFWEQPKGTTRKDNNILWKPLKSKKGKIEDARYIPITDKKAHNILAKYYKKAKEEKDKLLHGEDIKNYAFFFDHVTASGLRYRVKKAYSQTQYKYKSLHTARHSLATHLTKLSGNLSDELAGLILGHSKGSKTTQRYNLLYKEIVETELNESNKLQEFEEFDLEA